MQLSPESSLVGSCADAIIINKRKDQEKERTHSNSKQAEQGRARAARSMFSPTLLCILRLLLIIICLNCGSVVVGDLEFMYAGFSFSGSKLLLDGAASVTEDGILSLSRVAITMTSATPSTRSLFP